MKTRPAPAHRAPPDPLSDRWAFKPVAFLMLLATLIASSGALAVLISPPFLAAGAGVQKIQGRLTADGANFTGIPRLPQRSTIFARASSTSERGSPSASSPTSATRCWPSSKTHARTLHGS